MPNTTSASWPTLSAGKVARASDVEAKFDYSEHSLWPHSTGTRADNSFDLGDTTTAGWRCFYGYSINATSTAQGLAIGTTTVSNNSDLALEISGIRAFRVSRLSTTQRNNLAGLEGMIVYNSTTTRLQTYENGSWKNMLGASFGIIAKLKISTASATTQTSLSFTGNGRLVSAASELSTSGEFIMVLDSVSSSFTRTGATGTSAVAYVQYDTKDTTGTFAQTSTALQLNAFFKEQFKVFLTGNGAVTSTAFIIYEASS